MDAHKDKKRLDLENELMKHSDLIEDPKTKEYIVAKKEAKFAKKMAYNDKERARGIHAKMAKMEVEDESMEDGVETTKKVSKIKAKVVAKVTNHRNANRKAPKKPQGFKKKQD